MKPTTRWLVSLLTLALVVSGAVLLLAPARAQDPTPAPASGNPILRPDAFGTAPGTALATLVEFGDYQCPSCGAYHPVLKQLLKDFGDKVSLVFRNYPLPQHKNAYLASQAAEAAGLQGKFWPMHDRLYETQAAWSESDQARALFVQYAQELGLDASRFQADMDSPAVRQKIDRDVADGNAVNLYGTPTFYLNGNLIPNPDTYAEFRILIQTALLQAPRVAATPVPQFHAHLDFKVYLNGQPIDFSAAKYQSPEGQERDEHVHLHDGNGNVIHLHKEGVTLGEFFKSIGMSLTADCLVTDDGRQLCNSGDRKLSMYVNGAASTGFGAYVPQDLDRVLITYGSETGAELQKQLDSVTDLACIYSLKCPERGSPPTESCVGGMGTACAK